MLLLWSLAMFPSRLKYMKYDDPWWQLMEKHFIAPMISNFGKDNNINRYQWTSFNLDQSYHQQAETWLMAEALPLPCRQMSGFHSALGCRYAIGGSSDRARPGMRSQHDHWDYDHHLALFWNKMFEKDWKRDMKKEKGLGKAHVKICSLQKGRNITSKKAKKKWKQQKEIRKYAAFCWFALSFLHLLCRVSVSFSNLLFGVSFFTVFQKDETATITLTVSWIVCTILARPDISQVVWKVKNICGWSSSHVKELNLFKPRSKTFLTTLCQPLNTSLLFKTSSVVVTLIM